VSAPQPPQPTSTSVLVACTAAAVALVVAVLGLVVYLGSRPFSEPVRSRPLPASPARPSTITPVELRDCPINGCGPR